MRHCCLCIPRWTHMDVPSATTPSQTSRLLPLSSPVFEGSVVQGTCKTANCVSKAWGQPPLGNTTQNHRCFSEHTQLHRLKPTVHSSGKSLWVVHACFDRDDVTVYRSVDCLRDGCVGGISPHPDRGWLRSSLTSPLISCEAE